MYRPLNHNEKVIVSRTIYEERGLEGGLAECMFLAYTGRAMGLDVPEFDVFLESEVERKEAQLRKEKRQQGGPSIPAGELEPMEFLRQLEALSEHDKAPASKHANTYEWFYGDESLLDAHHKRLRVLFFNSLRYRKQVLRWYLTEKIITDAGNAAAIEIELREHYRKYPGTREGIISDYETFFGDASGLCYQFAMRRKAFHANPADYLKDRNLPAEWSVDEIKQHLKVDALEDDTVTVAQIECWEAMQRINPSYEIL